LKVFHHARLDPELLGQSNRLTVARFEYSGIRQRRPERVWIAAHAIRSSLVLVTNNKREFKRVGGLKVENWTV